MASRGRVLVLAAMLAVAASCGDDSSTRVIAEGRTGGPSSDEGCMWTLKPAYVFQGVALEYRAAGGGSGGMNVLRDAEDDDDVVWLHMSTFCVDAPTFVYGGVRKDVASVVLTSDGEQIDVNVLDIPGRDWGAVISALPWSWRTNESFVIEATSGDGTVVTRESYSISSPE